MKIAVLSNVNMNGVIRILKKDIDIFESEGYGNELGTLLNPGSEIYNYSPEVVFIINDIMEVIGHDINLDSARNIIAKWKSDFEKAIRQDIIYYISDAYCYGLEFEVTINPICKEEIEWIWNFCIKELLSKHSNIRVFPYRKLIEECGVSDSFSGKMWYLGKIRHTNALQMAMAGKIVELLNIEKFIPKKVLLLDLDNTLWGGLAGENDVTPIVLSDDNVGLSYKDLQRVILQMRKQGVILGIVSKNNPEDAMDIIQNNSHMVLKDDDFAIKKISWNSKDLSIKEIALELNLGLDSMVFFDDNPEERRLIEKTLPEVVVPDFPDNPEKLAQTMVSIYDKFFRRATLTSEDLDKTKAYIDNSKREEIRKNFDSFEEYLEELNITLTRKISERHIERITQLLNKTNQFNLTTKRHTLQDIQDMIKDNNNLIYSYQVEDIFGDCGIVAVVIVNLAEDAPIIDEFVMSCRVMGKEIENAIIDDIESELAANGFKEVKAVYATTAKNKPVAHLYDNLGYDVYDESTEYRKYNIELDKRPTRSYKLTKKTEVDQ